MKRPYSSSFATAVLGVSFLCSSLAPAQENRTGEIIRKIFGVLTEKPGSAPQAMPVPVVPRTGSPDYAAIVESLKRDFKARNGVTVSLAIDDISVSRGWAVVSATPTSSSGRRYQAFDALLASSSHGWRTLATATHNPGAEGHDAVLASWRQKYPDAPRELLESHDHDDAPGPIDDRGYDRGGDRSYERGRSGPWDRILAMFPLTDAPAGCPAVLGFSPDGRYVLIETYNDGYGRGEGSNYAFLELVDISRQVVVHKSYRDGSPRYDSRDHCRDTATRGRVQTRVDLADMIYRTGIDPRAKGACVAANPYRPGAEPRSIMGFSDFSLQVVLEPLGRSGKAYPVNSRIRLNHLAGPPHGDWLYTTNAEAGKNVLSCGIQDARAQGDHLIVIAYTINQEGAPAPTNYFWAVGELQ